MKIFLIIIAFLGLTTVSFAEKTKYIIYFKDKKGSGYSIDKPQEFLSPRAIERRKKHNVAIVENDIPVNAAYIDAVRNTGVGILNRSKWLNAVTIMTDDVSKLNLIRSLEFVTGIRKIGIEKTAKAEGMEELNLNELLGNLNTQKKSVKDPELGDEVADYGRAFNQINMLKGISLHQQGFTGEGVVIAVLDAGFFKADQMEAFAHLRDKGRLLGTRDFVTNDNDVFRDDNHGMNALSCIAAKLPGKMVGTAPNASFWLLRSEEGATEYPVEEANWVSAAEFADSVGADIISSSLGYTIFDDPSMSYDYKNMNGRTAIISRGANIAASKGIFVVNSAGNAGDEEWKHIGAPADADSVLSIGAVDENGEYVSFSSRGPAADGRIKPNVVAKGRETIVASPGGGIYPADGTSFSCPVISGMVACLVQANPGKTNMQIMDAIHKSSSNFNSPNAEIGYGIPDFELANRILGGDVKFNQLGDQLMEVETAPVDKDVSFAFFSRDAQTLKVQILDKKEKVKGTRTFELKPNSFNRLTMDKIRKFKKGSYTLVVTNAAGKEFSQAITRK
jgi:serine protease AprX